MRGLIRVIYGELAATIALTSTTSAAAAGGTGIGMVSRLLCGELAACILLVPSGNRTQHLTRLAGGTALHSSGANRPTRPLHTQHLTRLAGGDCSGGHGRQVIVLIHLNHHIVHVAAQQAQQAQRGGWGMGGRRWQNGCAHQQEKALFALQPLTLWQPKPRTW